MFYAKITAPNAQPVEMLIDTAADFDIYYAASFNPLSRGVSACSANSAKTG